MSKNTSTASDNNGEFEDWIEIYNSADYPINLNGYFLTDDEEVVEDQFAMFPNPESDRVTLKWFAGESSIDAYDAYGRVIENIKSTPGFPIAAFNVCGWEAGVYTVSFNSIDGKTTKKLVVE